ncbi:tRNA lysidine(34) synthetase TilS [Verrucomicrobiota bacterium sgz303538]
MTLKVPAPQAPDAPALVAVSGGRDSVALLHALVERGWRNLIACHLDHALRESSAEDARFVAELGARFGVAVEIAHQDVLARSQQRQQSVETAAREARYEFFARVAQERGASLLFLAHHADDQAETFLFRLLRGSGISGLQAMQAEVSREVNGMQLRIVRPLLSVWRNEIDSYIAKHSLPFREDLSNTDPRFTRNRLRHEIIPALEASFGRNVRRALWRAAEISEAENQFFTSLPELNQPAPTELSVAEVRAKPLAIQRRLIHRWLRELGVRDVSFDDVENVRLLLEGGSPAKINLAGGVHARRRAGRLFLVFPDTAT